MVLAVAICATLVVAAIPTVALAQEAPPSPWTVERITTGHDGADSDGESRRPAISADGEHVVFESYATNLGSSPIPWSSGGNILVKDLATGDVTRLNVANNGSTLAYPWDPQIDADGSVVVFTHDVAASNKVIRRDRVAGTSTVISTSVPVNNPSVDDSGERVVYLRAADPDNTDRRQPIWVHDTGAASGTEPSNTKLPELTDIHQRATAPVISGDGTTVVYAVDAGGAREIHLVDVTDLRAISGPEVVADGRMPAIDTTGDVVAYVGLDPGTRRDQVRVLDRTRAEDRVLLTVPENRYISEIDLSDDGSTVGAVVRGGENDAELWLTTVATGRTEVAVSGVSDGNDQVDLGADGRTAVFASRRGDLVPGDENRMDDVFIARRSDATGPAWPAGAALVAEEVGSTFASVRWPEADDDIGVSGYRVYVNGVLSAELPAAARTHLVTGLEPMTTYAISVIAVDGEQNPSTALLGSVTTTDRSTEPGTASLIATAGPGGSVTLSWDPADGGSPYRLLRSEPGTDELVVVTDLDPSTTTYTDTGLLADTTYRYRVDVEDGWSHRPHTVEVQVTTPALGTVATSWRGAGVLGSDLAITIVGSAGWQGSVAVSYLSWLGEDGSLLDEPRPVTDRMLAAEDVTAPGTYRATFTIAEGTASITAIEGAVTDGASEASGPATRLPLAVRAAAEVTVVAPEGSLRGARVVIDDVAQSPVDGGAVWPVAAVPAGERTIRVLGANGRELARTSFTFLAGRTSEVSIAPTIPGSLGVRVLDSDGEPVSGSVVRLRVGEDERELSPVRTDALGLAVIEDLDEGDPVRVVVTPPVRRLYVETTAETTVVGGGSVIDVPLVPMATGSLTGRITLDGTIPAVGAVVVAVQHIDGMYRSTTGVTDADGQYHLTGLRGPAEVHVNYRQDPATRLGTFELTEPPTVVDATLTQADSYRLQLNLYTRSPESPEWRKTSIDPTTAGSLYARLFVGEYNRMVQADEVVVRSDPGTAVRFCIDGARVGLGAGCGEAVLGDARVVPIDLHVESRAGVRASFARADGPGSSTRVSATIGKVVDGQTLPVHSPPVQSDRIDTLLVDAGSYLLSVQEYTLTGQPRSSRVVAFEVGDGQIADLGTIQLARTDWTESSSVTATRTLVAPGVPAEIRAALKPMRAGVQEDMVVRLAVPAGTEVIEGSVTVDGEPVSFDMDGSVALVDLGDRTFGHPGVADAVVVRARLATAGVEPGGAVNPSVEVTSTAFGSTRTQHVGSTLVRIAGVTMSVPSESASRTVELSGQAPAGATVTVSEGSMLIGTATATPAGLWFLTATLPDFGAYEHVLVAGAEIDGEPRTSAPGRILVDERLPVLERVLVRQSGSDQSRIIEIDPMAGVARFPYVWVGPDGAMQVDATFGGRGSVEDVYAHVGVGTARAEAVGGGRHVADVPVTAQQLGGISLDYRSVPGMATTADVPVLDDERVASILPPVYADRGTTVVEEDHDEAGNMRRAHLTTPLPSLGDGGEMKTTLSVTRGLTYTPTPQDLTDAGRAGVPAYGLSYSVSRTNRSLTITGSAYVPEDELGSSEAATAGFAPMSAFGVVRVGFQHAFTVGTTFEAGLGAWTGDGKYNRLMEMSEWVNANCSAANAEFLQGQLDRLGNEALAVDALKAGLLVAGLVAGPATFGIGTVGIWAAGFFLDKVLDLAFQHQIDTVSRMASETCRDDDDDWRDPRWPRDPNDPNDDSDGGSRGGRPVAIPTYIHDPSGYVFEAVPSNRVEGVTATLFRSESPDGPFQLWDADWYGQSNPLVTDGLGKYGWDVPEGYWQVRYSKDGYEGASSEVLRVLPPHFDVNVGIVSRAAPAVASVVAVPEPEPVIDITFDRYMQLGAAEHVTVTDADGEPVAGTVEVLDAEAGPTGTFARTFRFVADGGMPAGEELTVVVDAMAASYAGTPMVAGSTTTVAFPDDTDIRGAVTTADGQPLAGVVVLAFADTDTWFPSGGAMTGPDGTYEIAGLADGTYRVYFGGADDHVAEWYDDAAERWSGAPVTVVSGSPVEHVDASLTAASSVSGIVTGADGEPLAGVTVMAFGPTDTWLPSVTATTGEDGSYTLTGLGEGDHQLHFSGSDVVGEWYDDSPNRAGAVPVSVTGGGAVEGIDATLAVASTVSGTVTAADGSPLAGVTVMAFGPSDTWLPSVTATTAADGTYRLTGVRAGTYRIFVAGTAEVRGEWYDDSPSRAAATPVVVPDGDGVQLRPAVLAPM